MDVGRGQNGFGLRWGPVVRFCHKVIGNCGVAKRTDKYSRTSNNGHCRGIQILSVIGGVR
jgi:hypothetical protein